MRYKMILFLNVVAVLFIASGEIGIPLIIGRYVIDNPVSSQNFLFITCALLLLVLCAIIGNLIINFCSAKTASLVFKDLNTDIFEKIQTFSIIEMKSLMSKMVKISKLSVIIVYYCLGSHIPISRMMRVPKVYP
ncbi:MAG: ABC transporter ATP-binding protein, partial [Candidatus Phytoplasma australasiaticum]|nr:ABC transporter ATP-binding protein [Candidatus Phytoplasma australasiaticum]